jgi:hypothetical protein
VSNFESSTAIEHMRSIARTNHLSNNGLMTDRAL